MPRSPRMGSSALTPTETDAFPPRPDAGRVPRVACTAQLLRFAAERLHATCVQSIIDCPVWHSIAAEAAREDVRVHIKHDVDAVIRTGADDRLHLLDVRVVEHTATSRVCASPKNA
eukprot:scaffold55679_cov38-Tisochrysis_lutea.AAC.8